jgi:CHAT domain-containing protein
MLVEKTSSDHDFQRARYLMHRHPISVELAAVLVGVEASASATFAYDLVAFGKSDFSDVDQTRTATSLSIRGASWDALPAVEEEVVRIQSLFRNVVFRMNEEAEESSFRAMASQGQIVHVASHTFLNGNAPLQNAVILSSSSHGQDDGYLFLHEIQRLQLATHLVVLSGCNTALGVLHPGEGLAGLQYAFRAAGVPSTLATSWFVDDKASSLLMESFYRHLLDGVPKDVALQQAQIEYLNTASLHTSSPFFWAAPVLYGNTASMPLEGAPSRWTLLFVLPVVLALFYLGRQALARYRA